VDEFRPPFPGTLSTNSVSRYEVPSESDSEPHHITPTSGSKYFGFRTLSNVTDRFSAGATTWIRLPATH
jgi:hypothetical protein